MQNMLEAALAYAARGWPVFPVGPTKKPYAGTDGVLEATTDPAKIKAMWAKHPKANIAMDVGAAGFMILDLDPGHDLAALEKVIGALPKTHLIQQSPRGGRHLFYTLDQDEIVSPSSSKLSPKVDVRSFHSYVLLAPSHTIDGDGSVDGEYIWIEEGKPGRRSDAMVEKANAFREKHDDRNNWLIEPDLPQHVDRAIKWLREDARISVEGQGGDANAYATAAMMKSLGISQERALDLMWEHWNPRCSPPWSPEQFEHFESKVQHAYEYNTSPPGNCTDAYHKARAAAVFKPVQNASLASGREFTAGRFRFVDREGMQHIRPASWLIRNTIPAGGHVIIFGKPTALKTFICLDMGLSIATGFPFDAVWSDEVMQPGPVLFAVGEGRPELTKRVRAWERLHWGNRPVSNFVLADPVPSASMTAMQTGEWDGFIDGALELSPDGYSAIFIDTIGRSMQGMDENKQEHASMFSKMSEYLRAHLGGALIGIHHTGLDKNADRERGSSVFGADADTRLWAERPEDKALSVTLHMMKQKDAAEWKQPIHLKMVEVALGADDDGEPVTSLAAIRPDALAVAAEEARRHAPERAKERAKDNDKIGLEVAEREALKALKSNKLKDWTAGQLAEMICADVGVSSKTLRNRHLVELRENSATHLHRCYSPLTRRFRWVD